MSLGAQHRRSPGLPASYRLLQTYPRIRIGVRQRQRASAAAPATTRKDAMPQFDYDVVIIGSGFGGSVAGLRAAEKGYRVGVMEAGRRWRDEEVPRTQWDQPRYLWLPAAGFYGI